MTRAALPPTRRPARNSALGWVAAVMGTEALAMLLPR
jgi:hypothetical protein